MGRLPSKAIYMIKSSLLFLALAATIILNAQNIQFAVADPQPSLTGALFGDSEIADVDGDGDLDLLLCGREDGWVSSDVTVLYLNDGSGNFTADLTAPFPAVQGAATQFNDVDGDGDQDLFLTGLFQGIIDGDFVTLEKAELYINDGMGVFTLLANTPFPPCQDAELDFGDVDGDGDDDLFICGSGSETTFCKLFINDGEAQFTEFVSSSFIPLSQSDIQFADADGDNDLDIFTAGVDTVDEPIIALYLNDGDEGFMLLEIAIEPLASMAFAAGDLDQDGDADVLISGMNTAFLAATELYLNDGSGAFSLFNDDDIFTNVSVGQTLFYDLDGDDDLDILLSGSGDGGLGGSDGIVSNVYENLGDNNFVLADSLPGSYISNNSIGDLNGDGLADVVLSGVTVGAPTFKTWVYMNTTDGTVGLEERSAELFDVFPNPSNGTINIRLLDSKEVTISLFNMSGQLVFNKQIKTDGLINIKTDVPSGIYNLVINDNQNMGSRRIVIVD